jgi:hypothetical protein
VWKQSVILKYHTHASRLGRHHHINRRDLLVINKDAARQYRVKASDSTQHSGLAATTGTQKAYLLTTIHGQTEVKDCALQLVVT